MLSAWPRSKKMTSSPTSVMELTRFFSAAASRSARYRVRRGQAERTSRQTTKIARQSISRAPQGTIRRAVRNPFDELEPDPRAADAARALMRRLPVLSEGKMFGVLVVEGAEPLAAFSGDA